jgi:pyruvate dehydrogenase E2 component (dihydrolipoamide acetyltransferase)
MSERIRAIMMPKWGLSMSEGLVTAWHLDEGSAVEKGADAVDIETEKITNLFESPAGGVLRRRLVEPGDIVPVGGLLGVLADAEVSDQEIDAFVERFNAEFEKTLAARAEAADTGPQPETLEIGGHKIRYLQMGEGESLPLVLIHGFGGDLNNWLFNQPMLAERRPVVALDLPGHGGSSKSMQAFDIDSLARAVGAFLDALDLPLTHLAGHSLGGAVSARLALTRADRVRSLTLIASVGLGPDINMDFIRGFIGAKRRKDLKPVVEQLFADPSLVNRDLLDDLLKFKRLDGVEALLTRLADTVFADGAQAVTLRDELLVLDVATQVVWGAEDRIIPAAHAQARSDAAKVHVLEGAGHMVHMEKASEVNAMIETLVID